MRRFFNYFCFISFLFLSACTSSDNFAPVTDLSNIEPIPAAGIHKVTKGETLYEIAWRYGLDYRYLSQRNHIPPPFTIQVHQVIYLTDTRAVPVHERQVIASEQMPITTSQIVAVHEEEREPNYSTANWKWPTRGKIIAAFSPTNKGINIANREGEPIYAAAAGKVVYAGNGLRGYGNLIIIKHNSLYLSAYAHSNQILVRDGQWVKKGQEIAKMGSTGTNKVMLHFEIRRAGKSINPMSLYKP